MSFHMRFASVPMASKNDMIAGEVATIVQTNTGIIIPSQSKQFPPLTEQSIGIKAAILAGTSGWTTVMSYTGVGTMTKFWMAVSGDSTPNSSVFINISYDGANVPQFGGKPTTPTNSPTGTVVYNGINVSDLLTCGLGGTGTYVSATSGVTFNNSAGSYDGYICLEMPFSNGFQIQLDNRNVGSITYYIQSFYNTNNPGTPLRLYCTPFVFNTLSYPNEYPFISQTSPNGVFFKAAKLFFYGNTQNTNTFEGRFKFYSGGSGETTAFNANHYTNSTNQIPTPYQNGAQVLSWSTGTEDYVLQSFDFAQVVVPSVSRFGGILTQDNTNATNYSWTFLRVYDNKQGLLQSLPNTYFVGSWSCGDIITGQAGSLTGFWGYSFYYA